MVRNTISRLTTAAALFCAATALPAAAADEAVAVNAFATWQAQGQVIETGTEQVSIVGVLGGMLYVETSEGPADAGDIACPAVIRVNADTGRQAASGACVFTAHDGARAFGEWECTGVHLVGCRGEFRLTGGVGRFAGATGKSSLLFRGRLTGLSQKANAPVTEHASGIMVWRDLQITLKAAEPAKP